MKYKLMIKQHVETGLKYLCYTKKTGIEFENYKGSGLVWKRHLKKHGDNITTEIIYETDDYEQFKDYALTKSIEFNIIESNNWANLKNETGDGGDTVSSKCWITDGIVDRYWPKNEELPEGWTKGRTKCVFNDASKQKEFSSRRDLKAFSESLAAAWASGKFDKRDSTKCGVKGDNNPAKRQEVRAAISEKMKSLPEEHFKAIGKKSGASRRGVKRGSYKKRTI